MKTFLKATAASIIFGFATTAAYAEDMKPYVGIGLGSFITDYGSGFKSDAAFGGFLKAGIDINQYIGAELRVGAVGSSNAPDPAVPNTTSKIDFFTSYLLKPQFPITEKANIYGLIGATTSKATVTGSRSVSKTNTQVSFGGGLEYKIQDTISIGAEYVQYSNTKNTTANFKAKITGISATANYHF